MTEGSVAIVAAGALVLLALVLPAPAEEPLPVATVTALVETAAVEQDPDDPAIWVNTADPAKSRVIGTDKQFGLVVFDLAGQIVQELPDGRLNNVDIRQDVTLGGETVTLVAATKREDNTIVFYTVDAAGTLQHAEPFAFPGAPQEIKNDIYGIGFQHDAASGRLSVIASFKTGDVVQWLVDSIDGKLQLTFARQWTVPSQPEGVVGDDALGLIYVGEEDGGIWRYSADPATPAEGVLVDTVGSTCLPGDDVEGLAVLDTSGEDGYLVVSAQGVNQYALYARRPDAEGKQACIGSFGIGTGATDPVGETDGLEVTSTPLGEKFPRGMLVVQDDRNEGFTRNFKFVSWADVEAALGLPAD